MGIDLGGSEIRFDNLAIGFTSERDPISEDEGPYVSGRADSVGQRLEPIPPRHHHLGSVLE